MSEEMKKLLERLEPKVKRQNRLMAIRSGKAEGMEKRELNDEELKEFDDLEVEITAIKADIENQKKFDAAAKRNAEQHFANVEATKKTEEQKAASKYSLLRAIKMTMSGKQLDGVEAEVQAEAVREAKERGISLNGVSLPSSMMQVAERSSLAGNAASAGNLIATDLGAFIPALTPRLQVRELGATVMGGLVGNLDLPAGDGLADTAWEGETDEAQETDPTTRLISLRPKRLAGFTKFGKQLLNQSSMSVESWLRNELSSAIARAVDFAAINGSGTGNQPLGILNTAGIGSVAIGANGGVPTFDHIVDLETEIASANADVANMNYLTTPGIKGKLKKTALAANNAGWVWGQDLNGYPARISTQVPSDLIKGTSTDCHAIIFANWADLIIGSWGMVDITVDPYTLSTQALVRLVVNSYWDIQVKHAQSFAAIKDARVSA